MAPSETFEAIDIDQLPPASRRLLISTLPAISDGRLERYRWRHDSDLAQSIVRERAKRGCIPGAARVESLTTSIVLCSAAPAMTLLEGPGLVERVATLLRRLRQSVRGEAEPRGA